MGSPSAMAKVGQNPFQTETTMAYHIAEDAHVSVMVYDMSGKMIKVLEDQNLRAGNYEVTWNASDLPNASYIARIMLDGKTVQSLKLMKSK